MLLKQTDSDSLLANINITMIQEAASAHVHRSSLSPKCLILMDLHGSEHLAFSEDLASTFAEAFCPWFCCCLKHFMPVLCSGKGDDCCW